MWDSLNLEVLARLPREVQNGSANGVHDAKLRSPARTWEQCLAKLDEFRTYGEDWDGQGAAFGKPARTITPEVIDSAVELTTRLQRFGIRAPDGAFPDVLGGVGFDWSFQGGGLIQLEITEPGSAEIVLYATGSPVESVTLTDLNAPEFVFNE